MIKKRFHHDRIKEIRGFKKVLMIIGFAILGAALFTLFGFVVMWLWNWLMPEIFSLSTITFWQAVGIFILAKLIFGGINGEDSNSKHHPKKRRKTNIEINVNSEHNQEQDAQSQDDEKANPDYDELYEKWWSDKGEDSFNEYMSKNQSDTDTEE